MKLDSRIGPVAAALAAVLLSGCLTETTVMQPSSPGMPVPSSPPGGVA